MPADYKRCCLTTTRRTGWTAKKPPFILCSKRKNDPQQERSKRCRTPLATYTKLTQVIIQTFARYFNVKYTPIEVYASAIEKMAKTVRKASPNTYAELAEQSITPEEIHAAL